MNQKSPSPYLELLKKVLIDFDRIESYEYHPLSIVPATWKTALLKPLNKVLESRNFSICKRKWVKRENRLNGQDWPANAKTMIGYQRLSNLENCIRTIVQDQVEGDLIETGVWRGGATMFMKAVLNELGEKEKTVWLADSFQGVPEGKSEFPEDKASNLHKVPLLSVSRQEVENNFKKFDLWDKKIKFLEGWFSDTLPSDPIEKLALLRLDGDLYESTHLALENLCPKLSPGGFVIIDDYHAFPFCKKAVDDYRKKQEIHFPMEKIDQEAVFWRKDR